MPSPLIRQRLLLAPMAELSHRALRQLIEDFGGADEYYGEMASAGALVHGGPFERYYLDSGPAPERFVYQICGGDTRTLCRAAALLDSKDCLGIDINMGCCAPAIMRQGAGAAWLRSPDAAARLIAALRPLVKKRLSVKLRIGETADFDYLARFCRRLETEGAERITLHGRTTREKFRAESRWEYVEALKACLTIEVAGNGDISCADSLEKRAERSACDALMIGRLAVKEPWIFGRYRSASAPAQPVAPARAAFLRETALRFLDYLAACQPPEFHSSRARRFFHYFFDNLTWAHYMRTSINREKTLSGMERVLRGHFTRMEEDGHDP